MKDKKLYVSKKDKKICGICGGIAEYLNMDSTVVRVIFILATLVTGIIPLTLVYFVLAFVIPENPLEM